MTPRKRWKIWYRQYRIVRREWQKATEDMILFGSGFVLLKAEPDYIEHIPVEKVMVQR